MESNPSGQDPRKIWQNQPGETSKVTMELIRQKARGLHAKTRQVLVNSVISHLIAFVWCVAGVFLSHGLGQRIAYALGIVYTLAGAMITHRNMWAAPMPGDAGFATGIEFCRTELARYRAIFSRGMLWVAGPLIFAVFAYLVPTVVATIRANPNATPKALMNTIPFFGLLAIWAVAVVFIRMRGRQDLQREIDELDAIERASR